MIQRFARPYAKALSEVVTSLDEARKVLGELGRFEQVRRGSREMAELFDHPGADLGAKSAVIQGIAKKLDVSPLGVRVLEVLVRNHRLNQLGAILEAWKEMLDRAAGVAVAEVRVAHELNEGEQERLRKALESKLGQNVELQVAVDPSLLGGLVARVGSEIWDASVAGRIEKFRASLHTP